LVVAVLWQNGSFSYYPARIGAKVVSAYVEKQRRLAHNLVQPKVMPPAEMSAVWTAPAAGSGTASAKGDVQPVRLETGRFLVQNGDIVAQQKPKANPAGTRLAANSSVTASSAPRPMATQPRLNAALTPDAAKGH
jgi:hypothetical protein